MKPDPLLERLLHLGLFAVTLAMSFLCVALGVAALQGQLK